MNSLKEARAERRELEELSSLFHDIRDDHQKLPDPKPTLIEYFHSRVILIDGRIYDMILNILKPFRHDFNPITLQEATNRVINALLEEAFSHDEMISDVLVECGKSPEEAKVIVQKLRMFK